MVLTRRAFLRRTGLTAASVIGLRQIAAGASAKTLLSEPSQLADATNSLKPEDLMAGIESANVPLRDWSGYTNYGRVAEAFAPSSDAEIVGLVKACRQRGQTCRVVGLRTSWSLYWFDQTNDLLISTKNLDQLAFDTEAMTVTCGAGVTLETLHREAWKRGLTLATSPAPPWVTVGGAVSTGSHGSVMAGSMSSSLIRCRLVNGHGEIVDLDEHHPDFDAVRISLGMLGVMTEMTLQLQKGLRLTLTQEPFATQNWEQSLFESGPMSFVHANLLGEKSVVFKVDYDSSNDENHNDLIKGKNAAGVPFVSGPAHLVVMNYAPPSPTIAGSEWAVPLEKFQSVLDRFKADNQLLPAKIWMKKSAGESALLAAGSDPDKAYVQCGCYHPVSGNQDPKIIEQMVKKVENIMLNHNGRPHFAKLIYMNSDQMRSLYPKLETFQEVRQRMDPDGVFYTKRLKALFG